MCCTFPPLVLFEILTSYLVVCYPTLKQKKKNNPNKQTKKPKFICLELRCKGQGHFYLPSLFWVYYSISNPQGSLKLRLFPQSIHASGLTASVIFFIFPPLWVLVFVFKNHRCQETDNQHLAQRVLLRLLLE